MTHTAQASLFPAKQPSAQGPWLLPSGWEWMPIETLGTIVGGGTPSKSKPEYWNGTIPWVSPKDMKSLESKDTQDHVSELGIERSATKLLPPGAVLIVFRSGILAHTLPVAFASRPLTVNQDLKAIIPHEGLDPRYIAYALTMRAQSILSHCVKEGATVHSLEGGRFWSERVPIPFPEAASRSLAVQRRIVARIEALLAEVKEARALAAAIRGDTNRVMRAAVEEMFDNLEYRKVEYEPLGSLLKAKPQYGLSEKASDLPPGVLILRMANIVGGEVRLDDLKFVKLSPAEETKYLVGNGAILFNRTNSAELVGKSAVYEGPERVVFASYLICLVADQQKAKPRFLVAYINSLRGRAYIQSQLTQ